MEALATDIHIEPIKHSKLSQVDFENIPFGKIYSDHMLVADYQQGKWQGTRIVPFEHLQLSPANSCLHYGQSVFEGLKAFKKPGSDDILVFRPEENWKRINQSAQRICMPEIPEEIFMGGLKKLLSIDRGWVPDRPDSSLYIRPFLFATDEYIGLKPSQTYSFIIFTSPAGAYYAEPVKVKIEKKYARSCEGGTGFAKCAGNYAASMHPAQLAQQQGFHQLLWTDAKEHAYIEESGTMNVMFVIGDKLITAPLGDTILHGITRKSVLHLAREWGMDVEERCLKVDELVAAIENGTLKEAFGTGTAATIAHISLIHNDGTDYELPAMESRTFSHKVLKTLADIQRGHQPDPYGWVTKI